MYVDDCKYKRNDKHYRRTLLRECYRENGKVQHKTIANISHCTDEEIEAISIALKNKNNISYLKELSDGKYENGKIVGAVSLLYQVANYLGISKILGGLREGVLILWLVIARMIDQGSRLSAVRLAQIHSGCEILGIESLNENDLYASMDWLYEKKEETEKKIYKEWERTHKTKRGGQIFLYDVSSSYLEGECNELGEYGYNRDKKQGKKQIVYGLLTDEEGEAIAIEVFRGNTSDNKTILKQIEKIRDRFGCKYVTIVGDKGMIKSTQIEELTGAKFHYITSITKSQIQTLIEKGIIQIGLFDDKICEIEDIEKGVRYILRRNKYRAEEIVENRESKIVFMRKKLEEMNQYLLEHKKAKLEIQYNKMNQYIKVRKMGNYIMIIKDENGRKLELKIDKEVLESAGKLDGCYVIKTDLPQEAAEGKLIHARYKGLAEVERAFRTEKSELEVRPIFVRKKERTIAHLMITMMAYKIERYLRESWKDLDLTVAEGIEALQQISSLVITIGNTKIVNVPKPNDLCKRLLERVNVTLPEILPYKEVNVATTKNLQSRRKF
jgi:transposase